MTDENKECPIRAVPHGEPRALSSSETLNLAEIKDVPALLRAFICEFLSSVKRSSHSR